METQVIEKKQDWEILEYLNRDVEEEENEEPCYPEFDDWARWQLKNCPLMDKKAKMPVRIKRSREKLSSSLIDELLETDIFQSSVKEELSLEVKQLLKDF